MKIDLDWMRRYADANGIKLSDQDLQGVLAQLTPLKTGLARIKKEVDLSDMETPLTFVPKGKD